MRTGGVSYGRADDRVHWPSGARLRDCRLPVVEVGLAQCAFLPVQLPELLSRNVNVGGMLMDWDTAAVNQGR